MCSIAKIQLLKQVILMNFDDILSSSPNQFTAATKRRLLFATIHVERSGQLSMHQQLESLTDIFVMSSVDRTMDYLPVWERLALTFQSSYVFGCTS
jgi:hypothetical protein